MTRGLRVLQSTKVGVLHEKIFWAVTVVSWPEMVGSKLTVGLFRSHFSFAKFTKNAFPFDSEFVPHFFLRNYRLVSFN